MVFLAAVSALTVPIALGIAWLGAWPVLPFAGLEVAVVAAGLYWVSLTGQNCDVVRIGGDAVVIEKGRRKPVVCEKFDRSWVRVLREARPAQGQPNREVQTVLLGSHGNYIELGAFLNEEERDELEKVLRRCLRGAKVSGGKH